MIEAGFICAMGLLMMLWNLPWKWKLRIVSAALLMDVLVFVLLMVLHAGTYSGVMAATAGALFTQLTLAAVRKVIGCIKNGRYVPGIMNVGSKLQ